MLIVFLPLLTIVVCFYLIRRNKTVCNIIEAACTLTNDMFSREIAPIDDWNREWHTKKYLAAALVEKNNLENISDPDLKNLLAKRPELPASWLKKIDWPQEEGDFVDEAGNEHRHAFFVLVDGDIAWTYTLYYGSDGAVSFLWEQKCDAKEYDPKYQDAIREVNQKVSEEMERKNIKGLGSCHTFWELKKKYLKAKGIDWKLPTELNPGTFYD